MELSFALDTLPRGDAKQSWQEFSRTNEAPTSDDVEKWFSETFSNVKTIYDIFKELSTVRQRTDENTGIMKYEFVQW